jgi:hypothetical protein
MVTIGGDFNEEITNINITTRQQCVVEFMAEHQMLRKAFSASFADSKVRSEDCIPSLTNSTYLSLSAVSPKLQVMSEEILKAKKNKKTAFYNWKTNGRKKDIHDPFFI